MNDKRKQYLFFIFLLVVVFGIVGYRFQNYYIAKDYILHVFTPCDSTLHSCFEADTSIADPNFQEGPYEKVEITAAYAPLCLEEHTCTNFSCNDINGICSITYCSQDSLEDGESCTNNP